MEECKRREFDDEYAIYNVNSRASAINSAIVLLFPTHSGISGYPINLHTSRINVYGSMDDVELP